MDFMICEDFFLSEFCPKEEIIKLCVVQMKDTDFIACNGKGWGVRYAKHRTKRKKNLQLQRANKC